MAAEGSLEELPSLPEGALPLQRKLSKAIYGNVYLADLADPGGSPDLAAVKRMPREVVLRTGCCVESASNELHAAHALMRLGVPHVVEIIGTAQDNHFFYLVMEFCQRGELFAWLSHEGRVHNEALLRTIFWQVLTAVRELHREGIVHRDISLENILICSDGTLRLCDFGQALLVHAPGASAEVPVPYSELGPPGKPEYRAPETRVSAAPYFAKAADAFSCGVVLFALATGVYPSDAARLVTAQGPGQRALGRVAKLGRYLENNTSFSHDLKDLLASLLCPDLQGRASVEEALGHPWLVGAGLNSVDIDVIAACGHISENSDVEFEDVGDAGDTCGVATPGG